VEQVRHKIRQRVKDNDAKLVRLLKARNDREARVEAKAIKRAEIDERKRIRAINRAPPLDSFLSKWLTHQR